jgi:hypothetical protein
MDPSQSPFVCLTLKKSKENGEGEEKKGRKKQKTPSEAIGGNSLQRRARARADGEMGLEWRGLGLD